MTDLEVSAQMTKFVNDRHALHERIVTFSRSLVSVLKDAQRPAAAAELGALIFEVDVLEGEAAKFLKEEAPRIIRLMAQNMRGEKP